MYEFAQRCRQLFDLLEDGVSKELFKARVQFDLEPSLTNAMQILFLNEANRNDPALRAQRMAWKEKIMNPGGGKDHSLWCGTCRYSVC